MKVLFLDIDGVLNHSGSEIISHNVWFIDSVNVARLNRLFQEIPNITVCLSSSWRHAVKAHTININQLLEEAGWEGPKVIEMTPDQPDDPRGLEIDAWLKTHSNVSHFVILDDDDDMVHLSDKQVQTCFQEGGLQEEHVNKIIRRLI